MIIPFCYGDKRWNTKEDETVTVSELLSSADWAGASLHIVGSQENDYLGSSHLFCVDMDRDLAIKYFGTARAFSAMLHCVDEVFARDGEHLLAWARENGIRRLDELQARYAEYKRLFPNNCVRPQSYLRISA